jgi:sphinganine-1-phosphate aldolase
VTGYNGAMAVHPYADRFDVLRGMPSEPRAHEAVLGELSAMASEEDRAWEAGKISGSYYCGDHDHYRLMSEAFGLFGHVNALQRDVCPSATRFEGEIIAMGLDVLGGPAARAAGHDPVGMVTSGGSGSILHAVLAYRESRPDVAGRPNLVKPETAHPAFDKAAHLLGVEVRNVAADVRTARPDLDALAAMIDESTICVVGSAGNYGYGTIDPIEEMAALASSRGVGMHVDGCLGGFILCWAADCGVELPPFDLRVDGVTSMSADTHKYGYGLKGTSLLLCKDKQLRNGQYFFSTGWSGGKYCSPGIDGSRSVGLLAATWAGMVATGRTGYVDKARRIFDTSRAMRDAVLAHAELRIIGEPTFLFAIASDELDIYLVNDALRARGWRMNGLQYPDAVHMCVTGPQTQPGVVEAWADDLASAVQHAKDHAGERAKSGAIYGGVVGGWSEAADEFIRAVMSDMLDHHQSVPA